MAAIFYGARFLILAAKVNARNIFYYFFNKTKGSFLYRETLNDKRFCTCCERSWPVSDEVN